MCVVILVLMFILLRFANAHLAFDTHFIRWYVGSIPLMSLAYRLQAQTLSLKKGKIKQL